LEVVNPRQTILVTARYEGKDNIITLDWHMPVSFSPPLYAIAVGKNRFSHDLIKNSKVFVVNFMPFELKDKVLFCGRNSGKDIDKFKEAELKKEESEKIDCPRLKDAIGFLECKVVKEIDAGDHTIFIGVILNQKLKTKKKRLFHTYGDNFTTTVD
jgi:flavin reductase (DIM6/NTAB) family NADH-FMN oxidoreductase RutF